jgi:HK97 family phage portal protein
MITTLFLPRRSAASLRAPTRWLIEAFGAEPTGSGISVGQETALTYSAFYAAVRVLAESVASLPLKVYQRLERGKEVARAHSLYPILHDAPNETMSAFMFFETLQGHVLTWGNAFAEIQFNGQGRVEALWPLRPDRMRLEMLDRNQLRYIYTDGEGRESFFDPSAILHVRGLGFDGLSGYSPVRLARESIALGLATERHGATFFGNGSRPGGVLKHPGQLDEQSRRNLVNSWERAHGGVNRAHRVALLEDGISWQQIGIPNEDAQFLETRKFQVEDIARIFRIPPHLLGHLDKATFSNIEQQSLDFVMHSLRPWLIRWEQECNTKLLAGTDFFCEFSIDGLLRGDMMARAQYYSTLIAARVISPNEAREKENLNPVEGGDVYENPNTTPGGAGAVSWNAVEATGASPIAEHAQTVAKEGYARVLRKECKAIRAAVKRTKADRERLSDWVCEWYANYLDEVQAVLKNSVMLAYMADGMEEQVAVMRAESDIERYIAGNRNQLLGIIRSTDGADLEKAILDRLESWESER